MKTITILYYAMLREQRGCSREEFESAAETATDLYKEVQQKYDLRLAIEDLRIAVNNELVAWDCPIQAGDEVVFLPPVSGG